MARVQAAILAALTAAACASTPPPAPKPPTPKEMLVGAWNCTADMQGMKLAGKMTYAADGTTAVHLDLSGDQGGFKIAAAGDGAATWELLEGDTKLKESINSIKITSATLNGGPVEPALAQQLVQGMLVGQVQTSVLKIEPKSMTLTEPTNAAVTTCTKP
jgi:hypothetical protein